MFYQKVSLPYHVQKLDWWTKFSPYSCHWFESSWPAVLGQCSLLPWKGDYPAWNSGLSFWPLEERAVLWIPGAADAVEGSGELPRRVPPPSAQALGKMWELFFIIVTPATLFFHQNIESTMGFFYLINSNIVLPFPNYNANEPGRRNTR